MDNLGIFCNSNVMLFGFMLKGCKMFICEKCGQNSESGEKMTKIVVKIRQVKYENDSIGTEIVEEIGVCSKCKGNEL